MIKTAKRIDKKVARLLTAIFYSLIGVVSFLGLFLLFYWSLRLNASIDNLIRNYYGVPLYFWPYVNLTIGTLILFGINVPLLIYRWRKYGFPKLTKHTGGGLGAVIGVLASACPVCGSTLLSVIGVAGGLTIFPLLGDAVVKLVEHGVIDRQKFENIYKERGGLPEELKDVLDKPSAKPILLTRENANYYVNVLWAYPTICQQIIKAQS